MTSQTCRPQLKIPTSGKGGDEGEESDNIVGLLAKISTMRREKKER